MTGMEVEWLVVGWMAGVLTIMGALFLWSLVTPATDDPDGGPGAPGYLAGRPLSDARDDDGDPA